MGKRLFVSVDLDGLADEVASVQAQFDGASGLQFTDTDRIPTLVDELEGAVTAAAVDPFEVAFGGLGVFPSLDYISAVWVGTRSGGERLTRLHEAIEDRTTALGFDAEDHEFTPHVTVARMGHAGGKEQVQQLVRERDPGVGALAVDDIRLKESVLGTDRPSYDTVERIPL